MPYKIRSIIFVLLWLASNLCSMTSDAAAANAFFDIPKALPPDQYGTVLMNRLSEKHGVKPVVFSHWSHRTRHTCRVCHFELEFSFKANATEMTEAESAGGRYCGACHDGKQHDGVIVFGHAEPHCAKCHSGTRDSGTDRFRVLSKLPRSRFGNEINWVQALSTGAVRPVHTLSVEPAEMSYDKTLKLEAEWYRIPPAMFPHDAHVRWLDCNNCHPEPFNIKKKTTKHFLMTRILKGEFCGVCHLTVAFHMDHCRRCHPGIKVH